MRMLRIGGLVLLASISAEAAVFNHESEVGLVTTSGNTSSSSFSLKQASKYGSPEQALALSARYLLAQSTIDEITRISARNWAAALRFEKTLVPTLSGFVSQEIQSDLFAGIKSRLNSDLGIKSTIPGPKLSLDFEAGYRRTFETRADDSRQNSNYVRLFSGMGYAFNPDVTAKLTLEYLPNLSFTRDWQLNSEISLAAALSSVFAVKTGYLLRFDHFLNPGATAYLDTTFTTALVAKF